MHSDGLEKKKKIVRQEINLPMKKSNIILSGVGGQGILTIAAAISLAALEEGLNTKQAEVHGMSQRGGAVQSHLRVSESLIASDLIPKGHADIIISVELLEGLRYLPFLKKGGALVTNSRPFLNVDNYPDTDIIVEKIRKLKGSIIIDADEIAREAGSVRASNIVMLGAASSWICVKSANLEKAISKIFGKKGQEIVDLNLNAFRLGREASEKK
jgi:indolepyruvate ferredoxin oxidoreductase beta subunit